MQSIPQNRNLKTVLGARPLNLTLGIKMNVVFLIFILIFYVGCASREDLWTTSPFAASQIDAVALSANLGAGEYNLFYCPKSRSFGEIRLNNNSTRYFCISKGKETKFATLKKSASNIEVCLWKESGFCVDGVCESISSASDCKEI